MAHASWRPEHASCGRRRRTYNKKWMVDQNATPLHPHDGCSAAHSSRFSEFKPPRWSSCCCALWAHDMHTRNCTMFTYQNCGSVCVCVCVGLKFDVYSTDHWHWVWQCEWFSSSKPCPPMWKVIILVGCINVNQRQILTYWIWINTQLLPPVLMIQMLLLH